MGYLSGPRRRGPVRRWLGASAPAFIDVAVAPDEQGADPAEQEPGDDDEAVHVEVEAGCEAPESALAALTTRPLRAVRRERLVRGSAKKRSWKILAPRKDLRTTIPKPLHQAKILHTNSVLLVTKR